MINKRTVLSTKIYQITVKKAFRVRICSIEGCNKKHEAKGYCKNHYKSFLKYGNPFQVEANKKAREAQRAEISKLKTIPKWRRTSREGECSVEGCDRDIKAKQLCDMHYARWNRNNTVERKTQERVSDTCLVFGCDKPYKSKGLCETHYRYYNKYDSPVLPKTVKLCGVEGCYEVHYGKGFCERHYKQWKQLLKNYELNVEVEEHERSFAGNKEE
jgi:hypothetical protein